ncbi:MAG: molybdate ABC transporter substrate-binding protein [Alcanivoracaceae bacterium]|nr:molybdate ABC transporter substrate-binding protein [Alcanivoracaceae bacterium]
MDKYLIRYSCLFLLFFITACSDKTNTLNIAVASNFEKTLQSIVKQYQKINKDPENPLTINIIPGSSGILANQISNNAPFDLFLSADTSKAQFLFEKKKLTHLPEVYAIGNLALWIPEQNSQGDCLKKLSSINTLAIANPNTAPYGSLAAKIINKNNIHVAKIIYTANISQAYLYTKDNLAQAGFIAYSMLEKDAKGCIQVFQDSTLSQSMLLLNKKAEKLYHFILSKKIQNLIHDSGYNTETRLLKNHNQ